MYWPKGTVECIVVKGKKNAKLKEQNDHIYIAFSQLWKQVLFICHCCSCTRPETCKLGVLVILARNVYSCEIIILRLMGYL